MHRVCIEVFIQSFIFAQYFMLDCMFILLVFCVITENPQLVWQCYQSCDWCAQDWAGKTKPTPQVCPPNLALPSYHPFCLIPVSLIMFLITYFPSNSGTTNYLAVWWQLWQESIKLPFLSPVGHSLSWSIKHLKFLPMPTSHRKTHWMEK